MANAAKRKRVKPVPLDRLALRLGRAINTARGDTTQVQLSQLTGIDQASISVIERGLRLPTIEQVALIEQGLGLALGALFEAGYSEQPKTTLHAIASDAALSPVERDVLSRVYLGLIARTDDVET
jgi:transcriptional regulator with XRE-family HTH domain